MGGGNRTGSAAESSKTGGSADYGKRLALAKCGPFVRRVCPIAIAVDRG